MRDLLHLPAEWFAQDAILITWPHSSSDWADNLAEVESVYLDLVGAISHTQDVLIQLDTRVDPERLKALFEKEGINQAQCQFVFVDSNDSWARDHGPMTLVHGESGRYIRNFLFNGWGGKFPADKDNALNRAMYDQGVFRSDIGMEDIQSELEGGSIEVDGEGSLLTTKRCLLNANRQADNGDQSEYEARLADWLGLDPERIFWLEHGELAGDDTDAHIDTLARFAPNGTLVYQGCERAEDEHYTDLQAMAEELRQLRTPAGEPYRLIALPWPDAQYNADGERLAASYANFLITNQLVLMPTYGVAQDGLAMERLSDAFPERRVVGIDCRALIEQGGSLHCITMQIPINTLNRTSIEVD
ncbi:hypothetical protein BGP77_04970 [Saccharospirillum sp. MSK14-1]|uniref:agmatine deiminase family protein n=1 Tax=Saccharospirillum sp. MSK14-1 TaxID=1897632 RepID=UPI000D343E36|nr:agmatine deiminase family protein [Saccharospirillum sp. MSK14-1]PTY36650.1 hypothetical protein BGP77_04970 [Saccharospirillum sp. MSK14-1]